MAPIVIVKFLPVHPTVEDYQCYLDEVLQMVIKNQGILFLYDFTEAKTISSELRSLQADWIKKNEKILKENNKAVVFIVPSAIIGIIFKAILLVSKPPVAYHVFADLNSGLEWLRKQA